MIEQQLAKFGKRILMAHREYGGDIDGGTVQDIAEDCGLLVRVPVTEPCCETCTCAEYGDFPQDCLRLNPEIRLVV